MCSKCSVFRNLCTHFLNCLLCQVHILLSAGKNDQSICCHCGGESKDWKDWDGAWIEQAEWNTTCLYVTHIKGLSFILDCHSLILLKWIDLYWCNLCLKRCLLLPQCQAWIQKRKLCVCVYLLFTVPTLNSLCSFKLRIEVGQPRCPENHMAWGEVLFIGKSPNYCKQLIRLLLTL